MMKKHILTAISFIVGLCIHAQTGINTENPQGIFHIDAGKNSPITVSDDVVVDGDGKLGLGTLNPTAKIHTEVPTGGTALRINDGTESDGRILMSDAGGNASWGVIKGSGGSIIQITDSKSYPSYTTSYLQLDGTNTKIPIVSAGNYLITIRWWGTTTGIDARGLTSSYFYLDRNGTQVDAVEYYISATANVPFTFTTVLAAINCSVGDELEIRIWPSVGSQPWVVNGGGGHTSPSVTIFRM